MVEIILRPIYRLDLTQYRQVMQLLFRLEKKDWTRLRKAAGRGLVKAWREAVKRSRIQERTGWLAKSARFRSVGQYEVELAVIAYYAPALYYGANPSPGRYVPYMPCIGRGTRLVNPWRRVKVKLREYVPGLIMSGESITTYRRWKLQDEINKWKEKLKVASTAEKKAIQRHIKYLQRRLERMPGRIPTGWKLVQYDIGFHPGINARKLGLRSEFEYLAPIYAGVNVIRTTERITGVKLV